MLCCSASNCVAGQFLTFEIGLAASKILRMQLVLQLEYFKKSKKICRGGYCSFFYSTKVQIFGSAADILN